MTAHAIGRLIGVLLVVIVIDGAAFAGAYAFLRRDLGRSAANRTTTYLAVVFALAFPIGALVGIVAVAFAGGGHDRQLPALAIVALLWVWFVAYALWWPVRLQRAGRRLLRLEWSSTRRKMFLVSFGLFFVLVLIALPALRRPSAQTAGALAPLIFAGAWLLYLVAMWRVGVQIREHGLIVFPTFYRWRQVRGYAWEGERGQTLTLWLKWGPLPAWPTSVRVAPDQRLLVDGLLTAHVVAGGGTRSSTRHLP